MNHDEETLRELLHDAATQAPTFHGVRAYGAPPPATPIAVPPIPGGRVYAPPARRGIRWLVPAIAASVVAVVGAAGLAWFASAGSGVSSGEGPSMAATPVEGGVTAQTGDPGGGGMMSCVAAVNYRGRTYYGVGDVRRFPVGQALPEGASMPGCNDTGGAPEPATPLAAQSIPDVSPDKAIMTEGSIWVADLDAVPAEIKALLKPFVCTKSASVSQVTLLGSMGTPDSSGRLTPPYDMQAEVSADQGLDIGDLASVRIDLRMTAASQEPSDPMALQDAMMNQTPVPATFTCDGDTFVVEQIG